MTLLFATLAEPQSFSLGEKLVLVALIAASGALFWRRFGPILKRILKSRKDPNFSLAPMGRRIWDFFWQVLCQAKVIRERPLPGLAHAFVFWGFCAFSLVTLNHLAAGLGIGFLNPRDWSGASTSISPQPSPSPARSASLAFLSVDSSCGPAGSAAKSPTNQESSRSSSSS